MYFLSVSRVLVVSGCFSFVLGGYAVVAFVGVCLLRWVYVVVVVGADAFLFSWGGGWGFGVCVITYTTYLLHFVRCVCPPPTPFLQP